MTNTAANTFAAAVAALLAVGADANRPNSIQSAKVAAAATPALREAYKAARAAKVAGVELNFTTLSGVVRLTEKAAFMAKQAGDATLAAGLSKAAHALTANTYPKTGNTACTKCAGTGYLPRYSHVDGGICYACGV